MSDCRTCEYGDKGWENVPCGQCKGYDKWEAIKKPAASSQQVGGDHYAKLPIQPFKYAMANGLDPLQHTAIKYITRFRDKNGRVDLEKAKHCIDLLIQHEYNGGL